MPRHETIRYDSVCEVMRFRIFTDTFDQNPWFFILALFCTNWASGTVQYCTLTVLILTDGLRKNCGNTSKSVRNASSAPALFILDLESYILGKWKRKTNNYAS